MELTRMFVLLLSLEMAFSSYKEDLKHYIVLFNCGVSFIGSQISNSPNHRSE